MLPCPAGRMMNAASSGPARRRIAAHLKQRLGQAMLAARSHPATREDSGCSTDEPTPTIPTASSRAGKRGGGGEQQQGRPG